ncbi:uncharacterized protein EAE98_004523 [Botrytis deweyae]|uniref:Heterokaryon incompatibility domain-containing protein n=1 Tax=Botrytis deweyae TaxID=2478750 RepID=A0ABQ7IR41_9HELO|nr:uncharacterized protein EAE98_004523 [Botrytis deweyae]KAF7931787.1 hypothetical protein EAE98_004523 [Botrytis deweyae]
MSCQAAMDDQQNRSRAHTHLAKSVTSCFAILKKFRDKEKYITPFLDGQGNDLPCSIELSGVFNIIYWMAGIQSQLGTGSADFSKWGHDFLPFRYTARTVQEAARSVGDLSLCKNRLWNLVNVSDRKHGDLPDIVAAIIRHKEYISHKGHEKCAPSKCQGAQMDSTKVVQLHKCVETYDNSQNDTAGPINCVQKLFPVELLLPNLELGKSTAWLCQGTQETIPGKGQDMSNEMHRLCSNSDPYIALSHVWSDGTGVGVKDAGSVNSCLFKYFASIATDLKCKGIWWDALSIPYDPKARSKALSVMHSNYANASYTVVHDQFLLNFPWSDDGGPCLALVLSTWFTRGWTALELAMSKSVKVLFKDAKTGKHIVKDLDQDILAHSPRASSRAHWLATSLIQRLRRPIDNVGDLVTILSPRSTSWVRDRTIIASLLAGVPDPDLSKGESEITRDILRYLGKIPSASLLHGKPTMNDSGGYSWSPATLDDLPVEFYRGSRSTDDTLGSMLEIDDSGAVWGLWDFREVVESDIMEPYGNDLAATLRVQLALEEWDKHILLMPPGSFTGTKALLVVPLAILKDGPTIKCRYVGTVIVRHDEKTKWLWTTQNIQLGGQEKGDRALKAGKVWEYLSSINDKSMFDKDEMVIKDNSEESSIGKMSESANRFGEWLRGGTEDLSTWLANDSATQESYPADLSHEALIKALETNNRSATRVLVKNNVMIDPAVVNFSVDQTVTKDKVQQDRNDKKLARGLTLLGDVYAENKLFERAIATYAFVLEGNWAKREEVKSSLPYRDIQLALGQSFMAVQRIASSNRLASHSKYTQVAEGLFAQILEVCERNGSYWSVEINNKRREPTRGQPPTSNPMADKQKDESKLTTDDPGKTVNDLSKEIQDRRGDERKSTKWFQLELNAIAEMIALAASRYDFKTASEQCKRALRNFGDSIEDFEGFKPRWPDRRTQNTTSKKERDETVAAVYQRALKRLSSILKKHHPLLLVIRLHLGANYNLQSKYKQAEMHLNQVLSGLENQARPSIQGFNTHDSLAAFQDHHVLLALTKYHLGQTYMEQDRYDHARDKFNEALKLNPAGRPEGSELYYSTTLALCKSYLERDKVDADKALKLAVSVIVANQTEIVGSDPDWHLLMEANLSVARALRATGETNNIDEASKICEYTLNLAKEQGLFGEESNLDEADLASFYASLYEEKKLYEEAKSLRGSVRDIVSELEGPTSLSYFKCSNTLAKTLQKNGDFLTSVDNHDEAQIEFENAIAEFSAVFKGFKEVLGEYATRTLRTCQTLGTLHLALGQMEKAREFYDQAYQGYRKRYGINHRYTSTAAHKLGSVCYQSCKFTQAKESFLTAYSGYKEDIKKKNFHKDITSVLIDLAETCAVLGGPDYEELAEKYYNQALTHLKDCGRDDMKHDAFRVKLKKGDLFRQQKKFPEAKKLILEAYQHFCDFDLSELNKDNVDNGNAIKRHDSVEQWEAMLRWAELLLNLQQHEIEWEGSEDNPEELIREAKRGLKDATSASHPLTIQAAVLLGEICLQKECEGDCEGERELEVVINLCQKILPPGAPVIIRSMDCLIHHWSKNADKSKDVENMQKSKWKALKDGYGIDTAVAIMKMTDPKRENIMWSFNYLDDEDDENEDDESEDGENEDDENEDDENEDDENEDDEEEDGDNEDDDSSSDEDDMSSQSSDEEDLDLRCEQGVSEQVEQQCIVPPEYFTMVHNAQPVMAQPCNPEFQVQQQEQFMPQPQYQQQNFEESLASLVQNILNLPFQALQGFSDGFNGGYNTLPQEDPPSLFQTTLDLPFQALQVFSDGFNEGYNEGYNTGFQENPPSLFQTTLDLPFQALQGFSDEFNEGDNTLPQEDPPSLFQTTLNSPFQAFQRFSDAFNEGYNEGYNAGFQ